MKVDVKCISGCRFLFETDCAVCETVIKVAKAAKIDYTDVMQQALLQGLTVLVQKHLQKET